MANLKLRGSTVRTRPFYITVLIISLLAAYSFLASTLHTSSFDDDQGDVGLLLKRTSKKRECRQVHTAQDQCAFVKKYCLDDDAGLIPYLQLYFCTFVNVKPIAFAILVAWLGLLFTTIGIAASDFFSVNLSTIATILGLGESLAGVTFLAFGNGSPDVFSTFAAMGSNSASMAVGELIGAASFITGVVAGSMALVREFKVDRNTYARDICFFIVAVCFTTFFLADGKLRYWECWLMIGYYCVYVVTVVLWHWYTQRKLERRRREGEARSHLYGAAGRSNDELAGEPYRDDTDDTDTSSGVVGGRTDSDRDIGIVEQGPLIQVEGQDALVDSEVEELDDQDHARMVAAELTSSMRILRTRPKRSNTKLPIRPSLVGALEFRSALAQLQRESNLQLSSIGGQGRSYSENQVARRETVSGLPNATRSTHTIANPEGQHAERGRSRSASALVAPARAPELLIEDRPSSADYTSPPHELGLQVPLSSTSAVVTEELMPSSQSQPQSRTIGGNLAPPFAQPGMSVDADGHLSRESPHLHLQIPSRNSSFSEPSSGANSPFPRYTDSPMMMTPQLHTEHSNFSLPSAALSRDNTFPNLQTSTEAPRPVRWWPYQVLPPPHVLLATFFPTLQGWRDKTYWDKFVSAISTPSIFLLVITLPVVESETGEAGSEFDALDGTSHANFASVAPPVSVEPGAIRSESEWERFRRHTLSRVNSYHSARSHPTGFENEDTLIDSITPSATQTGSNHPQAKPFSDEPSESTSNEETASWNRWLVCLQLFTGPIFADLVLWANLSAEWENPHAVLVRMILYTLLASLIMLAMLLFFTSEQRRPKYHYVFCFMGFVISIAWISTIAGEVVGVLKTFGVVLGISEALLGLTIFAAGNSVGDLVADVTIARLGYPVMALSACFGGPMLNILLGIGIGGVLMMTQKANRDHNKHPDRPLEYKPYHVQVGGTLIISAVTLLIMLVGLLIVVPMNKWILSRKIGWTLIALWVISTVVNVVVELTGVWGEVS